MTDKTYEVLIDKQGFTKKPSPPQIPSINNRIANQKVNVTQKEFATLVGENGQTTVLATMDGKRNKNNMVQQQVVALDFDNTEIIDGKKVKTTIFFKGRTITKTDAGEKVMLRFALELENHGVPENLPKLEGKKMTMIIGFKKK